MNSTSQRLASEKGAVFIHVGLAIFMLMGICVYVFDFGIVWVSRGQAQNAADAGALSAALARAFDDFDDPPVALGVADMAGRLAVQANNVWTADAWRQHVVGLPDRRGRTLRPGRRLPQRRVREHTTCR